MVSSKINCQTNNFNKVLKFYITKFQQLFNNWHSKILLGGAYRKESYTFLKILSFLKKFFGFT